MEKQHAIAIDLDGTLWDTTAIVADAWNITLKQTGGGTLSDRAHILGSDIAGLMGLTAEEIRCRFFPTLPSENGRRLLRECFEEEARQLHHQRQGSRALYPGVTDGIARLAERFDLFIVSNCDEIYLKAFLDLSGLRQHFTGWECHGRTGLSKGENLRNIFRLHGSETTRSFYLGDTEGDLRAARCANARFGFAAYGFGNCSEYDFRFGDFPEAVSYLSDVS